MSSKLMLVLSLFCFISGMSGLMITYEVFREGLKAFDRYMLIYFTASQIPFFMGISAIWRDMSSAREAEKMDAHDDSVDPAARLEHQAAYRAIGKLLFYLFCYFAGAAAVYIIK